ncbi:hypothetical protein Hanom_Chr13g01204381 [Helianthus anomalus]
MHRYIHTPKTNPTAIGSSFLHHHAHHLSSLSLLRQPEHITTPPSPIAGKPHIFRYFVL